MNKTKKIITVGIKATTLLSLLLFSATSIHASEVTGNLSSSSSSGSQVGGSVGGSTSGGSTVSGTVGGGSSGGSNISGAVTGGGGGGSTIGGSVVPPGTGGTSQNPPGQVLGEATVAPTPTGSGIPGLPNTGFGPDDAPVVSAFILLSVGLLGLISYGLLELYHRKTSRAS